jgi:DNA-binding MarR family transcriptional regulator
MESNRTAAPETDALAFREQMVALVRAFGWHRPDQTPCGQAAPISEVHALIELARQETLPQHELGARSGLEKSTISRLVGQLEARGWAQRQRRRRDARVMVVSLTEKGRQAEEQFGAAAPYASLDCWPRSRSRSGGTYETVLTSSWRRSASNHCEE